MTGPRFLSLFFATLLGITQAQASPYFEFGTSLGTMKNGDAFFNQANATSSGFGFIGNFNFYIPVTSMKNIFHLELGLQNRIMTVSNNASQSFASAAPNLAARFEFWRFYVGAGYAPYTYVSKPGEGLMSLHSNPDAHSYFMEGGLIWRVIPEFQIAATYALEFGQPAGGGAQMTAMEYGLRFRFPISPKEVAGGKGVDFDGFRYPFGFMK
jgi:hypothetical protein